MPENALYFLYYYRYNNTYCNFGRIAGPHIPAPPSPLDGSGPGARLI